MLIYLDHYVREAAAAQRGQELKSDLVQVGEIPLRPIRLSMGPRGRKCR
jgi:hypothetical protein